MKFLPIEERAKAILDEIVMGGEPYNFTFIVDQLNAVVDDCIGVCRQQVDRFGYEDSANSMIRASQSDRIANKLQKLKEE